MEIVKIDHVSINVIDIDKTLDFYTRILRLKPLRTADMGDYAITYLALPDGSRLELFDYHGKNRDIPRDEGDVGLRHLCFQVADVAAHEAELRRQGVEITLPTIDLPSLGVRVVLFLDPNGVTLEFCENL